MNKRIVIFGNGLLHKDFLKLVHHGDYVIGVDRAAYWLLTQGKTADIAIGDFDSTTKRELGRITKSIRIVKTFPREKNWTDMELAIRFAISQKPTEVIIAGGAGTRADHTLGTLHLLDLLLDAGVAHTLVDATNRIRLIGPGNATVKKASYRYVSIIPYTKSITVTLTGFRYNIRNKTVRKGSTLGLSNELAMDLGTIHIFTGRAWLLESKD